MALTFPTSDTAYVVRSAETHNCQLKAHYNLGLETGEGDTVTKKFTHTIIVDCSADIRDDYDAGTIGASADVVKIPDTNGTPFQVVYVEILHPGNPNSMKRIYIARQTTTFPTSNL